MNTSTLQGFAAWARVALIKAVRAKLDAAMEPNSAARVDSPAAFAKLEEEIRANGGGEEGRAKTAERHAYRWFNRIVALRYMDANEFTRTHVVSGDDADNPNALPAVLSAAKRGEFDEDVFGSAVGSATKVVPTITALLDGTKRSNDPQGEAYGLLLRAYCGYWNRFMPFMFDKAGAADELLIPADLLASDSVLRKAVEAMPVADCIGSAPSDDGAGSSASAPSDEGAPGGAGWGRGRTHNGNVEIIGWLYQFYIAERKDEVMAGFKKNKKAGAAEIPAATQLFTPDWIVKYLVQNTVGRLWTQSHPESQLYKTWEYYILPPSDDPSSAPSDGTAPYNKQSGGLFVGAVANDSELDSVAHSASAIAGRAPGGARWGRDPQQSILKIDTPEDLTVCDPACGSGHMLTYAFDLLYDIYDEAGYSANEIPGLILKHNLFGMEIDERAANLAAFALTMKARGRYRRFFRKQVQPNIQRITPEYFTDAEVQELNDLYDVTLDADTWNTYQHADVYGSLIQPPTDLAALAVAVSAPSDEGAPGEAGWGRDSGAVTLFSDTLTDRARTVLTQTTYLARKYTAVVANPPYMGSNNMGDLLKRYVNEYYQDGKSDLYGCFYYRYSSLVKEHGGLFGTVIGDTWMFIKSFNQMRFDLLNNKTIESFIHIRDISNHPDIFGANAAFVVSSARTNQKSTFIKLTKTGSESKRMELLDVLGDDNSSAKFTVNQHDFALIPGSPIVYWLSDAMRKTFTMGKPLEEVAKPRQGLATADNNRFIREWWEVGQSRSSFDCTSHEEAAINGKRWFPHLNGGDYRKWYGNQEFVINWQNDGAELYDLRPRSVIRNPQHYFYPLVFWSRISSGEAAFRMAGRGFLFSDTAPSIFGLEETLLEVIALCNSSTTMAVLQAIAPTVHFEVGQIARLPFVDSEISYDTVRNLIQSSRSDWDSYESSWNFAGLDMLDDLSFSQTAADSSLVRGIRDAVLAERIPAYIAHCKRIAEEQRQREIRNNELVADAYGVRDEVPCDVPIERVSLKRNPAFAYPKATPAERDAKMAVDVVKEIISYAVGCMFGRYSLDKPGLILASQGETIDDYHAQVPNPSFEPDVDNVIPVTDEEWFEDDLAARFRTFLGMALGEQHVNENIAYIEQVLGKSLRKYFADDFYDDHVKMYKNRPIYWMYSSRTDKKATFKALVYLHRYTPATTNTVLKYLREFTGKLNAQSEAMLASSKASEVRKGEKLRTAIKECVDYERDVLYPLATRNLPIDLDDGVLVNYLRMGQALRTIKPIEAKRKTVQSWTWPVNPLEG